MYDDYPIIRFCHFLPLFNEPTAGSHYYLFSSDYFRLVSFTLKVFAQTITTVCSHVLTYRSQYAQQRCGPLSCRLFFGINAISAAAPLCRTSFQAVNWNRIWMRGNLPARSPLVFARVFAYLRQTDYGKIFKIIFLICLIE